MSELSQHPISGMLGHSFRFPDRPPVEPQDTQTEVWAIYDNHGLLFAVAGGHALTIICSMPGHSKVWQTRFFNYTLEIQCMSGLPPPTDLPVLLLSIAVWD
jgi:hypothetical protein